jgi:hypothetical protein
LHPLKGEVAEIPQKYKADPPKKHEENGFKTDFYALFWQF